MDFIDFFFLISYVLFRFLYYFFFSFIGFSIYLSNKITTTQKYEQ